MRVPGFDAVTAAFAGAGLCVCALLATFGLSVAAVLALEAVEDDFDRGATGLDVDPPPGFLPKKLRMSMLE